MNTRLLLITCIFLLSIFSVAALNYDAVITPIDDRITLDESARFELTIMNNELSEEEFRIKTALSDYLKWFVRTDPNTNPITVTIGPNKEATIPLIIKPNKKYVAESGSHFVHIEISPTRVQEKLVKEARIGIVSAGASTGYVPTVIASSNFPEIVNPSKEIDFTITLANQNNLNMSEVVLRITSEHFSEELSFPLGPKEEKQVSIQKQLDPKTQPGSSMLEIELLYEGKNILKKTPISYEVKSYTSVSAEPQTKKGLLSKTTTITYTNLGNVASSDELSQQTSTLKKFFGSTTPKASIKKEDGVYYYTWSPELAPYESFQVTIKEDYSILVIILVIIAAVLIFLHLNKSPLALKKEVTEKETDEESITQLKVLITVQNRSEKTLKDISVVDKIPKLLHIQKHHTLGSLKPSKTQRNNKHETLILWDIHELAPGEERVIAYYLKSNLQILGGLTLQPAMATLKLADKEFKPRSNRVFVSV